ncbi:cyclin-domain-containing protein [Lipomyces japonicus]|uniref:cyclin-domain-containing protein n=1 Tax=Lipomyces japonicus TaxID=56871 RepID=UPI0034CFEB64
MIASVLVADQFASSPAAAAHHHHHHRHSKHHRLVDMLSHDESTPQPQDLISATRVELASLQPADALRLLVDGIKHILDRSSPACAAWQPPSITSPEHAPPPPSSPQQQQRQYVHAAVPLSPPQPSPVVMVDGTDRSPSPMLDLVSTADAGRLSPGAEHAPSFAANSSTCACDQGTEVDDQQKQQFLVEKSNQRSMISRRFWSKTAPGIDIEKYLTRVHQYCPISAAVYMATSLYIYKLCVVNRVLPLTELNVHRLVITGLRVASKSLEDINHQQKRFAKVGGVSEAELCRLEIGFLFLIDFDLTVDVDLLEQQAGLLVDVAKQGR